MTDRGASVITVLYGLLPPYTNVEGYEGSNRAVTTCGLPLQIRLQVGRVADSRKATMLAANKLNGFAIVRKACRCGT